MVYPWSPGPVTSGRSRSSDARYSAGPLLASWVGWWRRRALDRFCGLGSAGLLAVGSSSGGVRSI